MKKTGFILICCMMQLSLSIAQKKPNIIFLFSDDQAMNTLGAYGNKDVITPNLDKLASMGVRFTNHYNTTAICMASRASVMTGLHEYRHGTNFGHGDLDPKLFDNSYPSKLREAGYYTGFVGKLGFNLEGQKFDKFDDKFDDFAGSPGQSSYETASNKKLVQYAEKYPHATRANGAWAQDFIKKAKTTGKPFCMSVSFKAPHRPSTPDPIDLKRYDANQIFSKPLNWGAENGEHLSKQSHYARSFTSYKYWLTNYNETVREYYALISGVDAAVGMIMESLKKEGQDKNTIIIFTSDNGYMCGAHGFGTKEVLYEESAKSPLIIYDPRLPKQYAGKVSESLTANVDMMATIFGFSGVLTPKGIDGKNLVPLLKHTQLEVHEVLPLFNFYGTPEAHSMAVVTKEWKYVYWYSEADGMKATEELFDLKKDSFEMHNVVTKYPEALKKMKDLYNVELKSIKEKVISNHGYEDYTLIFDQNIDWKVKEPLAKFYDSQVKGDKKGRKDKQEEE